MCWPKLFGTAVVFGLPKYVLWNHITTLRTPYGLHISSVFLGRHYRLLPRTKFVRCDVKHVQNVIEFSVNPRLLGRDICLRWCSVSRPNVIHAQATETCRRIRVLVEGCGSLKPRPLYLQGNPKYSFSVGWVGLRDGLVVFWETKCPTHAGNRTLGLSADSLLQWLYIISCSLTKRSWSICVSFCLYLLDCN